MRKLMRASLTDREGRIFASAEVEADTDAVQAAIDAGAGDAVAGIVPDVLMHGGRLFVRRTGLDYYEATVSVVSGPPVLARAIQQSEDLGERRQDILARSILRADGYGEGDEAWPWAVELAGLVIASRTGGEAGG